MRVYAPVAFRWTNGVDYPYGWQDLPQALADSMKAASKVVDEVIDTAAEQQALGIPGAVSGAGILPASNYTYEVGGAGRLIGYTRGGIAHSITYPTSTTALITSAQGYQRSITLDATGRVVGVV